MSEQKDWIEAHRALAEYRQEQRAQRRLSTAETLTQLRVTFTSHNGGAQLVLHHDGLVADFWPGTGRWKLRNGSGRKDQGRGFVPLLNRLGIKHRPVRPTAKVEA